MKDTRRNQYLGVAGELRVMSELLLRGHNPSKSYLDHGIDIILENGKKIQVKTATRFKNKLNNSTYYHFTIGGWYKLVNGEKKKHTIKIVDYFIFWCMDDNQFYIIPSQEVYKIGPRGGTSGFQIDVYPMSNRQMGKNEIYKNRWDLLNVEQ